ncbi:MAG TPA: T9SS type A sorting domain-containing protein [Fluviicola sp.]|nr:T9SS type A sorting domain-containing protein [Fluviicola sp.]
MNHYFTSLPAILLLSLNSFAQQTINWGPEISVADGATYGNLRPRLALTTNDEPVVIFGKNSLGKLFVAKGNAGTFGTPVDILPANLGTYLAGWTGPDIAAKGDTVIAVFKALPFEDGDIYAVRSTDGGLTFSDTIRVDDHETGRTFLPALTIDNNGNPIIDYMIFDGQNDNPRYVVAQSTDAGLTYGQRVEASTTVTGEACDCCPAEMVTDGTNQVLLFRNNESNIRDIHAVRSTDGGMTFPNAADMEELGWFITSCPSTGPQGIIISDSLFTVAASRAGGSYRVYIGSGNLTGGNLALVNQASPIPPDNANGSQNYPRISGEGNTMVLVWEEKESSNPDVFCAVVTNGNISSFADYKARVNTNTTGVQTNPDIVYKNGFAHIVYQDAASGDVIYRKGTVSDVAGTAENDFSSVTAAPNPSVNGVFTISGLSTEITHWSVTDLSGKTVAADLTQKANGLQITLDPAVGNGVYLLTLENQQGKQTTTQLVVRR